MRSLILIFLLACGRGGTSCPAPRHPVTSVGDGTSQNTCPTTR